MEKAIEQGKELVEVKIDINRFAGPDRDWLVEEIERLTGHRVWGNIAVVATVYADEVQQ